LVLSFLSKPLNINFSLIYQQSCKLYGQLKILGNQCYASCYMESLHTNFFH